MRLVLFSLLTSFLLSSSFAKASHQVQLALACQQENCMTLKKRYGKETYKVQDQLLSDVSIKKIAVKVNPKNKKIYLLNFVVVSGKKDTAFNSNKAFLIYRHQIISTDLSTPDNNGDMLGTIHFDKKMSLKSINQFCLLLSKDCQWKSELDDF